jgi:hypothetical protein
VICNAFGCVADATTLNWHVHQKAIPEGKGCGDTGGHWDPTFGCGDGSQYQGDGDWCQLLAVQTPGETGVGRVNPQTCEPKSNIATCEMGDLSNKMKPVKIKAKKQRFTDKYISDLTNIAERSIVFHCGKTRVACGNFALIKG